MESIVLAMVLIVAAFGATALTVFVIGSEQ
jgi:hypothetical protein